MVNKIFSNKIQLLAGFGKYMVDCYNEWECEDKKYTLDEMNELYFQILDSGCFIPDVTDPETKETHKAYKTSNISIIDRLWADTQKAYKKSDIVWKKYCNKVQPNEKLFRETADKLFCKLSDKDREFFTYYVYMAIRRLKGMSVKYPIFLGLYGKMGDGKDSTLTQLLRAFGVDENNASAEEDMTILNSDFGTYEFYTRGLVRFSEISATKSVEIAAFKRLITSTQISLNEKGKDRVTINSRNVYCGTANEHFSRLTNESDNRRIAEITWKSLIGTYTEEEIYDMFVTLVNSCPYDNVKFIDNDKLRKALRNQKSSGIGNFTEDKIMELANKKDKESGVSYLSMLQNADRLNKSTMKEILSQAYKRDISSSELSRFLEDERYITQVSPTSRMYKLNNEAINELLLSDEYDEQVFESFINWTEEPEVPPTEPTKEEKEDSITKEEFFQFAWETKESCAKDAKALSLTENVDYTLSTEVIEGVEYIIALPVVPPTKEEKEEGVEYIRALPVVPPTKEEKEEGVEFKYIPTELGMPVCKNKWDAPSFDNSSNNEFVVSAEYTNEYKRDLMAGQVEMDRKGEHMNPVCFVYESDDLPVEEQKQNLKKVLDGEYKENVLWATESGHKSIHTLVMIRKEDRAIIKDDFKYYWSKVGEMLYGTTEHLDKVCASVGRLTRTPNAIRDDGNKQTCLYVNEDAVGLDLSKLVEERKVELEKAKSAESMRTFVRTIKFSSQDDEQSEEQKLINFYHKNPSKWALAYETLIENRPISSGEDLVGTLTKLKMAGFVELANEFGYCAYTQHPSNITNRKVMEILCK